ncbi:MAG: hypothetical protein IAE99_11030 [Rhodothermales bacterium]|nr:hypothetical protein [Rhodothermales bacterium]
MRRFYVLACTVLAVPAAAQPALYVGVALGTNVGGLVGVGVEAPLGDYMTGSVATGLVANPWMLRRDNVKGIPLGLDAGVKVFPLGARRHGALNPFVGVNYGLVDAGYGVNESGSFGPLKKDYAFSYTLGLRRSLGSHVEGSVFAGLTSDAEQNRLFNDFFPRLGVLVGYRF